MKNLVSKLIQIRKELPGIVKDKHVAFGSTNYLAVSETGLLKDVKPFFDKYNLALIPEAITHMEVQGKVTFISVRYNLIDADSGEVISVASVGNGHDSADKGAGKAFTYATKHAYLKLLMLISAEDPDDISSEEIVYREKQPGEEQQSENPQLKTCMNKLDNLLKDKMITEKEAKTLRASINGIADQPDRMEKAVNYLDSLRKEKE